MIWLLTRPVVWPVKTAAYSAAAGYKTGRLLGYRRLFVFGLGVAVGVLVAKPELREQIVAKLTGGGPIGELPRGGTTATAPTSAAAAAESIDLTD